MSNCIVCKVKPIRKRRRCVTCLEFQRRNGRDKAPAEVERDIFKAIVADLKREHPDDPLFFCDHCGERAWVRYQGQCETCFKYERDHGCPRSISRPVIDTVEQTTRICGVCATTKSCRFVQRKDKLRCNTCIAYFRRNGVDRTPEVIGVDTKRPPVAEKPLKQCCNCRKDTPTLERERCHSCYTYLRRNGFDRPADGVRKGNRALVPTR